MNDETTVSDSDSDDPVADESSVKRGVKARFGAWIAARWPVLIGPGVTILLAILGGIIWVAVQITAISTTLNSNSTKLDSNSRKLDTVERDVQTMLADTEHFAEDMREVKADLQRQSERIRDLETAEREPDPNRVPAFYDLMSASARSPANSDNPI